MIAIQKIGKSFLGALNYNLKKMYHPGPEQRAELLDSNFTSIDSKMIRQELKLVRSLRPNLNRYVYHTSLNFSNEDKLDNEKLLAIALDYLNESGFTNNQYMIFRHHDSGHPHIHLLVNRITFDGEVVSDSNNYKRSEAILRKLEEQYNLVTVEQSNHRTIKPASDIAMERANNLTNQQGNDRSIELPDRISLEQNIVETNDPYNVVTIDRHNHIANEPYSNRTKEKANNVAQKAPTKDELEMVIRTGKPSQKMLLQEIMNDLLSQPNMTLHELIRQGEKAGVSFLFNQASTGRITGITYFHDGFKIKGQALGNRFKWAEIIKKIDYEQTRDGQGISQANSRAKAKYGASTGTVPSGQQHRGGPGLDAENIAGDQREYGNNQERNVGFDEQNVQPGNEGMGFETESPNADHYFDSPDRSHHDNSHHSQINIEITDDEDDAKKRRKRGRHR